MFQWPVQGVRDLGAGVSSRGRVIGRPPKCLLAGLVLLFGARAGLADERLDEVRRMWTSQLEEVITADVELRTKSQSSENSPWSRDEILTLLPGIQEFNGETLRQFDLRFVTAENTDRPWQRRRLIQSPGLVADLTFLAGGDKPDMTFIERDGLSFNKSFTNQQIRVQRLTSANVPRAITLDRVRFVPHPQLQAADWAIVGEHDGQYELHHAVDVDGVRREWTLQVDAATGTVLEKHYTADGVPMEDYYARGLTEFPGGIVYPRSIWRILYFKGGTIIRSSAYAITSAQFNMPLAAELQTISAEPNLAIFDERGSRDVLRFEHAVPDVVDMFLGRALPIPAAPQEGGQIVRPPSASTGRRVFQVVNGLFLMGVAVWLFRRGRNDNTASRAE